MKKDLYSLFILSFFVNQIAPYSFCQNKAKSHSDYIQFVRYMM